MGMQYLVDPIALLLGYVLAWFPAPSASPLLRSSPMEWLPPRPVACRHDGHTGCHVE